jgi:hypothetical protein
MATTGKNAAATRTGRAAVITPAIGPTQCVARRVLLCARRAGATTGVANPLSAQETVVSPSHRAAATELLALTHVREMIAESADKMLEAQLAQIPQRELFEPIIRDFYHEQMNWDVLEPEFTRLYVEVFTEPELRDIAVFYRTPLGKTMLAKMPLLMAKSNELTQRRLQAALPTLMQRLQEAAQKAQAGARQAAPADSAHARKP